MRLLLIAYRDTLIDRIFADLKKDNEVNRINLLLDENQVSSSNTEFNLKNFHDLTIEIMDTQPSIILYFPLNNLKLVKIIHIELVDHLIDFLPVINATLLICPPFTFKNEFFHFISDDIQLHKLIDQQYNRLRSTSVADLIIKPGEDISYESFLNIIQIAL